MTPGRPDADQLPDWRHGLVAQPPRLGWKTPCPDPEAWKAQGRAAFRAALLEDDTPLDADPQVLVTEQRDGYRVEHLTLTLGRFRRTGALLAVPDGPGPFPAALVLHDHGALFAIGKEKMIRPLAGHPQDATARDWVQKNYEGAFVGDEWARQGWVVLSTDAYGWGDRACAGYEAQQALAANLLGLGTSWAGVIAVEDAAAARWLAGQRFVTRRRVAAVGFSMGAVRAWQAHALSDDVKACAAVCSFGTVAGLMAPGGNRVRGQSAFAMTHPGLARLLDFPDIAALGAPKPLLLLHGRDDRLFPAETVAEAYLKTAQAYRGFGFEGRFRGEWRPGGHVFGRDDQKLVLEWLGTVLPGPLESTLLS